MSERGAGHGFKHVKANLRTHTTLPVVHGPGPGSVASPVVRDGSTSVGQSY